jgi:hypothetical protein
MRPIGICVLATIALAGCRERRSEPVPTASATTAAPVISVSAAPSARPSVEPVLPATLDGGDAAAAPVGGNWLKCYANFQPRTDPKLDVMRLGLMCGPSNGMRQVTDAREAAVSGGGAGREHRWTAEAGDCYRVFAVGEAGVADLDVEDYYARGARIAWDTSDDRWPIVKPDGPFCVMADGEYRAVVRAQRGSGRYAVEIWRLR